MDNQQVTETDKAWLAGFIDGEGYLGLRIHKFGNGNKLGGANYPTIRPEFHVVNTDKAMIDKCASICRKMNVNLYLRKTKGHGKYRKEVFKAQTKGINKIYRLLSPINQYLTGIKQERGKLIAEFCFLRINARDYNNPFGSGRVKPYTRRELEVWEKVQPLMRRGKGTSETTRGVLRRNAELLAKIKERNDGFLNAMKI